MFMRGHRLIRFAVLPPAVLLLACVTGCPMESGESESQQVLGRRFISPRAPSGEARPIAESGEPVPEDEPALDVMAQKLDEAIAKLTEDRQEPLPATVAEAAISQGMEALFMSNLVILPSAGVPEAEDSYSNTFLPMAQRLIDALTEFIAVDLGPCDLDGDGDVDAIDVLAFDECRSGPTVPLAPGCAQVDFDGDNDGDQSDFAFLQRCLGRGVPQEGPAASAFQARNFIQVFIEASQIVAGSTRVCDPQNPTGVECELLRAPDEGGVVVDDIVPGFSRQVRSPFFVADAGAEGIQEQVIAPDSVDVGECTVVVKEIQGIKAVIRPVLIPIWVEPWFARARIVGFQTVWVWEFIPAEFIKSISYCNNGGVITDTVQIQTVIERELLHFWSFPRKDISPHSE